LEQSLDTSSSDDDKKTDKKTVYNRLLIAYLTCTILKNFVMGTILFVSLFRFYRGLRKINLEFNIHKGNLVLNILAFGLPIIAGFSYGIFLIIDDHEVSIFAS
jgi:hypothetical protein